MAVDVKQEEVLKRLWIQKALRLQLGQLIRLKAKEFPGSEIEALRQKEIDFIHRLIEEYTK